MINSIQALLGSQAAFSLSISGAAGVSRVVAFTGREALSRLFEFDIDVAGPEVELSVLVGKDASFKIDGIDAPRFVNGIISEAEHIGYSRRRSLYRLKLVPHAWRLKLRQGCRIHQNKTTLDILADVFKEGGIPTSLIRFDASANYEPRNYCVQYRETDFDFISRLMEEDGIFYFFEHTSEETKLVVADYPGAHPVIPGTQGLNMVHSERLQELEMISAFRVMEAVRPGRVTLRDINLHKPDESMEVTEEAEHDTDLEIYDYPGEYQNAGKGGPGQGKSIAKIRLEELQASRRRISGESNSARLTVGHVFTLLNHQRAEFNTELLVTEVTHRGEQPQALDQELTGSFEYENSFACIEKSTPFRPARTTVKPTVRGVQSATVVGPASEEIHTDEEGRVLVQFHWDREGKRDENSSCWIRVSQSWAGAKWGAMFLPRIGHEVLVDFIEGDPDRPVITGRIYHGNNETPYPLPDEKTKSTIKSESSPDGGGSNELRFEDCKGQEEIFIHAQKDMNEVIEDSNSRSVGSSQSFSIGSDQSFSVGNNQSISVGANQSIDVTGDRSLTVNKADTTTVETGSCTLTVSSNTYTATAQKKVKIESGTEGVDILGKQAVLVRSSANDLSLIGCNNAVLAAVNQSLTLQAKTDASLSSQTASVMISAPTEISLWTPQAISISGKTIDIRGTEKITLSVGASSITIGPSGISVSGPKITSSSVGVHEISGALIKIN